MQTDTQGHKAISTTRLVEAVIIAAIVGGITLYGTSRAFEERFEFLKIQINDIKSSIKRIETDFYRPNLGQTSVPGEEGTL